MRQKATCDDCEHHLSLLDPMIQSSAELCGYYVVMPHATAEVHAHKAVSSPTLHPVDPELCQFCQDVLPAHGGDTRQSCQDCKGCQACTKDGVSPCQTL